MFGKGIQFVKSVSDRKIAFHGEICAPRFLRQCIFICCNPTMPYSKIYPVTIIVFRADDSSPPVARPRSTSARSAEDVSNDSHVNGSNRLSADLDNYAQVSVVITVLYPVQLVNS